MSAPGFIARLRGVYWRFKYVTIPVTVLVVAAVLFEPVENWRGRRAWQAAKAELEAKGERLEPLEHSTSPIPDEENRFKHPFSIRHLERTSPSGGLGHPRIAGVPGAPFMLSDLRQLPRQPVTVLPFTRLLAQDTGHKTNEAMAEIAFASTDLADVLRSLFRQSSVTLLIPTNNAMFRDGFNRPIKLTFTETNIAIPALIDDLLARHQLVVQRTSTNGAYTLAQSKPSLQDVINTFKLGEATLAEFDEMMLRPKAFRWEPIPFENFQGASGWINLRGLGQVAATRTHLAALAGDHAQMLREFHRLRGATDCALGAEPANLVGAMIHTAMIGLMAATVEELLREGMLTPADCAAIQQELTGLDTLAAVRHSLQSERAETLGWLDKRPGDVNGTYKVVMKNAAPIFATPGNTSTNTGFLADLRKELFRLMGRQPPSRRDLLASIAPRGWLDQNRATMARMLQPPIDSIHVAEHRIDAATVDASQQALDEWIKGPATPYRFIAQAATFNLAKALMTCARNQTRIEMASVACALERFRADRGHYPEKLSELMPAFASRLPNDLFDGQPLRYRRTPDGKFLLYSIGWNMKDDGGDPGKLSKPSDPQPDWVWGK